MRPLENLKFDNRFINALPADPETANGRRQVRDAAYSRVTPTPVASPKLVAASRECAALLGISEEETQSRHFAEVFAGNRILEGMDPYAARYGGHQFGNWAGQLGDGRAIALGAVRNEAGEHWELQLKGSGPTPYSRTADGRAVMRSSIREFLCSEAMFHLGVPTTRALSLVSTGDSVMRDMFYDGRPGYEQGAIVCRVAPSFLRFGNFEIVAASREFDLLKRLADHAIGEHFGSLPGANSPTRDTYVAWLSEVCHRTAIMVTEWMRVGFVHGVMNTDNMSLLGLTIDYGPYGWLEDYDPNWTPNTTDAANSRYRYAHQPRIALWNLVRLAEAIYPLIEAEEPIREALGTFTTTLNATQDAMFTAKLGLQSYGDGDDALAEGALKTMMVVETDMTLFYRALADIPQSALSEDDNALASRLSVAWYAESVNDVAKTEIAAWLRTYLRRVEGTTDEARAKSMNMANPLYVMRNYLAQVAIDAADEGDYSEVETLLDVMRNPYTPQDGREKFAAKRPEWARHRPGCSMLSCSS